MAFSTSANDRVESTIVLDVSYPSTMNIRTVVALHNMRSDPNWFGSENGTSEPDQEATIVGRGGVGRSLLTWKNGVKTRRGRTASERKSPRKESGFQVASDIVTQGIFPETPPGELWFLE